MDAEFEKLRRKALVPRTPEELAKAAEERRRWNAKAHAPELAALNERMARLEGNNAALHAVGLSPSSAPVVDDPRDLSHRELLTQIDLLDRLIVDQTEALKHCRAEAESAARERLISTASPLEQLILLRLEALEADFAELKAATQGKWTERPVAKRSLPVMSGMGRSAGDGLTPGVSLPPSIVPADLPARRTSPR